MTPVTNPTASGRSESAASLNGSSDLSDRVRSLRLSDKAQSGGGSRSSVIPWTACVLMLLITAAFGYRTYLINPTAVENPDTSNSPASNPTAPSGAVPAASSG